MPDTRKTLLPGADFLYNAFFDPKVQALLEPKRIPRWKKRPYQTFLRAWPILVFEITGELANEVSDMERHIDWFSCYKLDRQFTSELLAEITRFVRLPKEQWDLRRALAEFANTCSSQSGDVWETLDDSIIGLMPWKEMADHIEANCPHLKSIWLSGDRLRKKEFHSEKGRRQAILDRWRPNFSAFHRFGRNDWLRRIPCVPG